MGKFNVNFHDTVVENDCLGIAGYLAASIWTARTMAAHTHYVDLHKFVPNGALCFECGGLTGRSDDMPAWIYDILLPLSLNSAELQERVKSLNETVEKRTLPICIPQVAEQLQNLG